MRQPHTVSASASAVTGLPPTANWLQRIMAPAVDPEVFDFWVQHLNPAWSWSRPLATIVERRVEARDTVTLVLQPNRHVGGFLPGQHVNVSAEVNGRRVTRSYSLTNVPAPARAGSRRLSITVKRVEGGALSTHLVQHAQTGFHPFARRGDVDEVFLHRATSVPRAGRHGATH